MYSIVAGVIVISVNHKVATIEAFDRLDEALDILAERVRSTTHPQGARLWLVRAPKKEADGDGKPVPVERLEIYPTPIPNSELPSLAAFYLSNIHFEEDQVPTFATRAPGVLQVSSDTLDAAADVNAAKDRIKELLDQVPENKRRAFMRDTIKRGSTSLIYVYRHINILAKGADRIRFHWSGLEYKQLSISKTEAHLRVDRGRYTILDDAKREYLDQVRSRIDTTDRQIRYRAPQAPKPLARIRIIDEDGNKNWSRLMANIPILTDQPVPATSPLAEWIQPGETAQRRRQERTDHGRYEPLCPEVGLYQVREEVR